MDVYCEKCNGRLMVPHPEGIYVCLGCESSVKVVKDGETS